MAYYTVEFEILRNDWGGISSRRCSYSLALGDVAFADFDVDAANRLVRISFDGYGCCTPDPSDVLPMSAADSEEIIGRAGSDELLNTEVARTILRRYFEAHRTVVWEDALIEWGLVERAW